MERVRLPADEWLHTHHRHEWWYFAAWLTQPSTGRRFHYTTALMRNDLVWVSYFRWWPEGGEPTLTKALFHPRPLRSDHELWLRPRDGWAVLLTAGRSHHHLGVATLHFDGLRGLGPCLHTTAAEGGIVNYGGANEMAWYSWPDLTVRGTLQGVADGALTGTGWMEHQWGNTDFRRLRWRYTPILVEQPVRRRFLAYQYVHADTPKSPSRVVGELWGGELRVIPGAAVDPTGPGDGPTLVDLPGGDQLVVRMDGGGAVNLQIPGVPVFTEAPSRVTGRIGGGEVAGVAMTEFNPSVP